MFRTFGKLIDFILPRFCVSCNIKLSNNEEVFCNDCNNKLVYADDERLRNEYKKKFSLQGIISDFKSLYVFIPDSPIQDLIHSVKYNNSISYGYFLGEQISGKLGDTILNWNPDLILPVPLHHLKKAERGYNQSALIGKEISKLLNIPFSQNILQRKRYTQTQTALNLVERKENIRDAFKLKNANRIKDLNIILIDDVITTGATVTECGKVLKRYGAKSVYALSCAIAD